MPDPDGGLITATPETRAPENFQLGLSVISTVDATASHG